MDDGAHITQQFAVAVMHSVAMITVDTKPLIVAADADFQQTGSFSNVDEFFTPDELLVQTGL